MISKRKSRQVALTDYEDFIHHVIMAFEKTQQGLDILLDSGLISEQIYIEKSRKNFQRYKQKAEEFAKSRFGQAWQSALEDIKNFRNK